MGKSSWIGPLPNTATQVAELQNSFLRLRKNNEYNLDFFRDTVLRLYNLKQKVEAEENRFYSAMNLPNGERGLKVLQERLDRLNSDPGFRSMSNLSDSFFDKLVDYAITGINYDEPFEIILNDPNMQKDFFESTAGENIEQDIVSVFIDALNKARPKSKSKGLDLEIATVAHQISSSTKRGLRTYISSLELVNGTIPPQIKMKAKDLPQSWRRRLETDYNISLKGNKQPIVLALKDWLSKNIKDQEILSYVMYQFNNNIDKYAINKSYAAVKGFLGEVRTAAFLDYLCGRMGVAIPAGILKTANANTDIPIDIVLESFGFQVKNYQLTKNGAVNLIRRSESSMSMGNFIELRLKPDEQIKDILTEFFGSYQFNQPIEDATPLYRSIYKRFEIGDRVKGIFDGYLDNILKISEDFSVENSDIFGKQQLYFNTFFVISDRIVPSSYILQQIINELEQNSKEAITSSYYISSSEPDENVWLYTNRIAKGNLVDYANKIKVHWNITLNLNKILGRIV